MKKIICLVIFLTLIQLSYAQQDSLFSKKDTVFLTIGSSVDSFKIIGKPLLGNAGMYSAKADGTKTASGEPLNNADFTGACNRFKFNTWVKVTNLINKKMVLVRITDRTSKKKGAALIELTRAAVAKLGFLKTGSAKIKIEETDVINLKSIKKDSSKGEKSEPEPLLTTIPASDSFVISGKTVTGIASFYSTNLDGTKTTTGERYRNARFTAASNNFKMNTWVLVTNLRNQKTVVVRINDHMHPRMKKKGRVVDLSRAAAEQLDFISNGLTKVKVQEIRLIEGSGRITPALDTLISQPDSTQKLPADTTALPTDSVKADDGIIVGVASFYSTKLDGTKTSTGEIYRNSKLSAASNDFKLNTWVRVTNLKNNKSVILRINDRMHTKMQRKGRVVDLSRIAAKRLDFLKNGLTKVKVEVVPKGTIR